MIQLRSLPLLRPVWCLAAVAAFYLLLAGFVARNKLPWCDEGWYGGPAYNIAYHGSPGTPNFYTPRLPGVREHTYWENPGFISALAAWVRLMGFGILQVRTLPILLGLAVVLLWYVILKKLGMNAWAGVLAALFIASDYLFVMDATYARADMMGLAFTCAAYAAFLHWRSTNLSWALVTANTAAMISGVTHPNTGLLTLIGLAILIWPERSRLRWKHLWLCSIPYVLGATAWGAYIAADPQSFLAQLRNNSDTRFNSLLHPLSAIKDEIVSRYVRAYGLGPHSPGTSRMVALKGVVLAMQLIGLGACLMLPELRKHPGYRLLLKIFVLYLLFFTFLEGSRTTYYLVWILPLWMTFAAGWVVASIQRGRLQAWVAVGAALAMLAIQCGGLWSRARQSPDMGGFYQTVQFLQSQGAPNPRVFASIEFGYALGFVEQHYTDDVSLGVWSGIQPEYVVIDPRWQDDVKDPPPNAFSWSFDSSRKLKQFCAPVFSRPYYEVYRCQWDR